MLNRTGCTALAAAVRVMQPVTARSSSTGQPLSDAARPRYTPVCAQMEGRATPLRTPHAPGALA